MLDRFRAHYDEQGIGAEVYLAVHARRPTRPLDFDRRVKAVEAFRQLPEAQALAGANKRVSNILTKQGGDSIGETVDPSLLQDSAEKALAEQVDQQAAKVVPLFENGDYASALSFLASLREPVDNFFDEVMVMADDDAIRKQPTGAVEPSAQPVPARRGYLPAAHSRLRPDEGARARQC